MTRHLRTVPLSVSVVLLTGVLVVGVSRDAHPRDPIPALPGTSDTRNWWQSRLDLLREGMGFEEVRALLPPWGGTEAGTGGGGRIHLGWVVSPHWHVQVVFTDEGRFAGNARLMALEGVEGTQRAERIARLVLRRRYEDVSVAFVSEQEHPTRRQAWHVEGEVEVHADGRYRWTQVSHTDAADAAWEGTLPVELATDLAAVLGVGSTPLQVDEGDAGPETPLPAEVAAVLSHLRGEHRGPRGETR